MVGTGSREQGPLQGTHAPLPRLRGAAQARGRPDAGLGSHSERSSLGGQSPIGHATACRSRCIWGTERSVKLGSRVLACMYVGGSPAPLALRCHGRHHRGAGGWPGARFPARAHQVEGCRPQRHTRGTLRKRLSSGFGRAWCGGRASPATLRSLSPSAQPKGHAAEPGVRQSHETSSQGEVGKGPRSTVGCPPRSDWDVFGTLIKSIVHFLL